MFGAEKRRYIDIYLPLFYTVYNTHVAVFCYIGSEQLTITLY